MRLKGIPAPPQQFHAPVHACGTRGAGFLAPRALYIDSTRQICYANADTGAKPRVSCAPADAPLDPSPCEAAPYMMKGEESMPYSYGWAALNLEMTDRVPRTEYSADSYHWALIERVTGIQVTNSTPRFLTASAQTGGMPPIRQAAAITTTRWPARLRSRKTYWTSTRGKHTAPSTRPKPRESLRRTIARTRKAARMR